MPTTRQAPTTSNSDGMTDSDITSTPAVGSSVSTESSNATVRSSATTESSAPSAASTAYRKMKAKEELLKKKKELLRIEVELAAAHLAVLQTKDSDIEDEPVTSDARPEDYPTSTLQIPAGGQDSIAMMVEAFTLAIKNANKARFVELPVFGGSHREWIWFRAAYYETENMFTAVENMNRLRRNLKGRAMEAVERLFIAGAHPTEVMKALETRFGRPESIALAELETLRGLPRLTDSPLDMCIFASKVANIVATLKVLGCAHYLYSPDLSRVVVDKFTPMLRYRYYDFVALQPKEHPELVKIDKFLQREAELCGPFAQPEQVAPHVPTTQQKKAHRMTEKTKKSVTAEKNIRTKYPVCSVADHTTLQCEKFKNLTSNRRLDTAKLVSTEKKEDRYGAELPPYHRVHMAYGESCTPGDGGISQSRLSSDEDEKNRSQAWLPD